MKTNLFIALSLAFVAFACEPVAEDLFSRTFVIKAGAHYSTPRLVETLQSDRLTFTAVFDHSAIYDLGDPALQSNKNKLFGFSGCNATHHENSARFAWQWFGGQLEIYAYCYVNGERKEAFVGVVKPGEENLYEIQLTDNAYVFYLNNERKAVVSKNTSCEQGVYYLLYPYFGGSVPAPHDVSIKISRTY